MPNRCEAEPHTEQSGAGVPTGMARLAAVVRALWSVGLVAGRLAPGGPFPAAARASTLTTLTTAFGRHPF